MSLQLGFGILFGSDLSWVIMSSCSNSREYLCRLFECLLLHPRRFPPKYILVSTKLILLLALNGRCNRQARIFRNFLL